MRFSFLVLILFCQIAVAEDFVGIPKKDFQEHYQVQRQLQWCWASSAEMVLAQKGVNIPQGAIVTHVKGAPVNATAGPREMLRIVNGVFPNGKGEEVVVSGQYVNGAPAAPVLYNQLKNGNPVILLYRWKSGKGHAVVLTGIRATVDKKTGVFIDRLYVFDPFPYQKIQVGNTFQLKRNENLIYRSYRPQWSQNGLQIQDGVIAGMILVDGTSL